ncbi:FAD-dependent oxidoreductase [Siphonobacter aquaeclarae]|uniref:Por secretion system C-terminal sorting domain-containing protein n=1 Tax=Siphonobacter aquaeclarae TaxID=563176 RepID=A0A1G9K3Q4_9BACT|nr:FAD-dependent oxidoreductase [Siphonobacter aquaeclarae]SDL44054.1 Por secretion system C-terminal sorting domain-containing protein [Siphonobacter aquaeclarae]
MLTVRFSPRKLIVLLLLPLFHTTAQTRLSADVCIYGGTSAGVIAAYTASKLGKSVILIEPGKYLGGMTTGGLGFTDVGKKEAITGLARDFYRRVGAAYKKSESFQFEPHVAAEVFQAYLKQSVVKITYQNHLTAVRKEANRLAEITTENPAGQKQIVSAAVFLDCSYEGDLMAKAGVSYTAGREGNKKYREKSNGVYLVNFFTQFPENIDPYKIPGNPASGFVWGISGGKIETNGSGDNKIQAYNYRLCLTSDPGNQLPFSRPADYDSTRYELLLRLIAAKPGMTIDDCLAFRTIPNKKVDVNNAGPFSTDMIGENYDYVEADYATRDLIARKHANYIKGFLHFIAYDPRIPAAMQKDMRRWGYPKDEYTDNGNWSPQLYVREARRMISEYVVTEANCMGNTTVDDGVAWASYTMDSHHVQRGIVVQNGKTMIKNEGNVQYDVPKPFPISYRSIVPKEAECANLIVPVCVSASHIAYGSVRMEPVFMALAQAGAVAAAMSIASGKPVQQIDVGLLQQELLVDSLVNNPIILPGNAPLSLKLVGFTAIRKDRSSRLEWRTVDERNVGHFAIERSSDGTEFLPISFLTAQNSSSQSYEYVDSENYRGVRYYRLKMVDQNGSYQYSRTLSLVEEGTLAIGPNPVRETLKVLAEDPMLAGTEALVFDLLGMIRHRFTLTKTTEETSLKHLSPGVYLLRFQTGKMFRLVKE